MLGGIRAVTVVQLVLLECSGCKPDGRLYRVMIIRQQDHGISLVTVVVHHSQTV